MPICPECRAEYAEGSTECPDCRVSLVESPPPGDEAFVTVFEGSGESLDYRMAYGLLASNGFHLKLIGGHDASYPPLAAQIQVAESEADTARELLSDPGPPDASSGGD